MSPLPIGNSDGLDGVSAMSYDEEISDGRMTAVEYALPSSLREDMG